MGSPDNVLAHGRAKCYLDSMWNHTVGSGQVEKRRNQGQFGSTVRIDDSALYEKELSWL